MSILSLCSIGRLVISAAVNRSHDAMVVPIAQALGLWMKKVEEELATAATLVAEMQNNFA